MVPYRPKFDPDIDTNALAIKWLNVLNWMNIPFSHASKFLWKMLYEYFVNDRMVVMLLPKKSTATILCRCFINLIGVRKVLPGLSFEGTINDLDQNVSLLILPTSIYLDYRNYITNKT